jgi:hypothetical protein
MVLYDFVSFKINAGYPTNIGNSFIQFHLFGKLSLYLVTIWSDCRSINRPPDAHLIITGKAYSIKF